MQVETAHSQQQDDKIEDPQQDKKVSLRSFNLYITNQRITDLKVIVDSNLVAFLIVIHNPMCVPLKQSTILHLQIVDDYLEVVCFEQEHLQGCSVMGIEGLNNADVGVDWEDVALRLGLQL